jgi:hypothetical protein
VQSQLALKNAALVEAQAQLGRERKALEEVQAQVSEAVQKSHEIE